RGEDPRKHQVLEAKVDRAAKLLLSGKGRSEARHWNMYAEPEAPAVHCPRCHSEDIEALGRVHSSLYWFSCFRCHCIWWMSLAAGRIAVAAQAGRTPIKPGALRIHCVWRPSHENPVPSPLQKLRILER